MGRLTKFNAKVLRKARKYLESAKDTPETYTIEKFMDENDKERTVTTKVQAMVNVPTKGGLALALGINRDTVQEWSKIHPEFSVIVKELEAEQEDRLINNGLSGRYNSTVAKILLAKHGYREESGIGGLDGEQAQGVVFLPRKLHGPDTDPVTGDRLEATA